MIAFLHRLFSPSYAVLYAEWRASNEARYQLAMRNAQLETENELLWQRVRDERRKS